MGAMSLIVDAGCLVICGERVQVVPVGPQVTNVACLFLPSFVSNEALVQALSPYGKVLTVTGVRHSYSDAAAGAFHRLKPTSTATAASEDVVVKKDAALASPLQVAEDETQVKFPMCDISARMRCLAERRSKVGQTVTGKYANAMRVSNSIAAATARPTFFRFISFETRAPNLRQTVAKGDAGSVRVVRSTPGKQRRNARVAVPSVSTVRD
ncbi:hypothetical protein HPB50_028551 [Hyalomma asiaticum]|nr:hypothetical protein HPB50_028551 [Hyalomma asiaticum]